MSTPFRRKQHITQVQVENVRRSLCVSTKLLSWTERVLSFHHSNIIWQRIRCFSMLFFRCLPSTTIALHLKIYGIESFPLHKPAATTNTKRNHMWKIRIEDDNITFSLSRNIRTNEIGWCRWSVTNKLNWVQTMQSNLTSMQKSTTKNLSSATKQRKIKPNKKNPFTNYLFEFIMDKKSAEKKRKEEKSNLHFKWDSYLHH